MSKSLWNDTVNKWVTVDDEFTTVQWETTEPIEGESAKVRSAANGFIVEHREGLWVETSLYAVQSRLEKLLQRTLEHERAFYPNEYRPEKLTEAGYQFPSE